MAVNAQGSPSAQSAQSYSREFARVYNRRWSGRARHFAVMISEFYGSTALSKRENSVIDLCCGTGHLAVYFLQRGYRVTGVDASEYMLQHAAENARSFVESGQARFLRANIAESSLRDLNERFGLAVSTFDSLNHLPDEQALEQSFQSISALNRGYFVFDLVTRVGLTKTLNRVLLDDSDPSFFLMEQSFWEMRDESAWIRITGFDQLENGLYEKFSQTISSRAFALKRVEAMLYANGWKDVRFTRVGHLARSVRPEDAEEEDRVFVIASTEARP